MWPVLGTRPISGDHGPALGIQGPGSGTGAWPALVGGIGAPQSLQVGESAVSSRGAWAVLSQHVFVSP